MELTLVCVKMIPLYQLYTSLLVLFLLVCTGNGYFNFYPKISTTPLDGDPGSQLVLTHLIEANRITEAQNACRNTPFKGDIISYSGFFTVSKMYNSNMFFWFFPAINNNSTAPVILWLQGGPGATSLFGVFSEHGPFTVKNRHGLKLRSSTWITSHSVIYIDNPIGTGFSYTDNDDGYSKNENDVGFNLYAALEQFFQLFPQFQKNDFFIAGESYAAKFIPTVANMIDTKNPSAHTKINLKGLAIGNGFFDPEHMLNYGEYYYQVGLLDSNGMDRFRNKQHSILGKIQQKKWQEALVEFNTLLNGDTTDTNSDIRRLTGFSHLFNYLHTQNYDLSNAIGRFISNKDMRKNLHVGAVIFNKNVSTVQTKLASDIMQSVKPTVEVLLERYRVLMYNGQLDMIVPFPLIEAFLDTLRWSKSSDYKKASRKQWYIGEDLAGYSRLAGKLTVVLVRNAGHMVPLDQPEWFVELIRSFTSDTPL